MKRYLPLVLVLVLILFIFLPSRVVFGQAWSSFLDPSRAFDWSTIPQSVPAYTVTCPTQPSLVTGSGNAATNATAINNAIASCNGTTQNVVNIGAGTFYTNQINFGGKSNVVLRGAGPQSTYLYVAAAGGGCYGLANVPVCMGGSAIWSGNSNVIPPGGSYQCAWTGGYSQGSTTVTLNACGSPPIVGYALILDQQNDQADTNGVVNCDTFNGNATPIWPCSQKGPPSLNAPANADGRTINNGQGLLTYSQQQVTMVTNVSGSGTGPYTVTISPGVMFNNVRSGQFPGAWWAPTQVTHEGVENMTLDHTSDAVSSIGLLMIWCNSCWFQNNRSIAGGYENHTDAITDYNPIIQNNYFYGSQHLGSESYCVQMEEVSGGVVQNNIMHNVTSPDIKDAVTGSITAYNFTPFINFGNYMQGLYASHNAGSYMNLLEGNASTSAIADDIFGTSGLITAFRNHFVGWQPTYTQQTYPFSFNSGVRGMNVIGNVLGEPGYATNYATYATSTTGGQQLASHGASPTTYTGSGCNTTIYEIGWTDTSGLCVTTPYPAASVGASGGGDPLSWTTLMRWGNYDVVNAANIFDATEASPTSVPYIASNFTSSYFTGLSHTLPNSLYLSAKPSWFKSIAYPPYGPDVTSGTTGRCTSGTFSGLWVTASSQCAGGSYSASQWGGHANANPAQVCYLTNMAGPPDGSGGVLNFNPAACYAGASPTLVSIAVTPSSASITTGNTQSYTATGTYSDSSTLNITTSVAWSSSLTGVATINSSGVATGAGTGTTTITATLSPGTPGTATLNVSSVPVSVPTVPFLIL